MSAAPPLRLDTTACERCGCCVPVCEVRALRVGPGYIFVDWTRCTACGKCAAVCESGAITRRDAALPHPGGEGSGGRVVPIAGARAKAVDRAAAASRGEAAPAGRGDAAPAKRVLPRAGAVAWTLPEGAAVLAVAFVLLIALLTLRGALDGTPGVAGFLHAGYYAVLAVLLYALARRRGVGVMAAYRLDVPPGLVNTALAVAVATGCWLFSVSYRAIASTVGVSPSASDALTSVFGTGLAGMLATVALVAVAASFLEETLLRGVLLEALAGRMGAWPAIVASAAAFALLHASLWSLLPLTVLGIGLGWLATRGRSLWPAVIAHMLYNAIFLAFYYASAR